MLSFLFHHQLEVKRRGAITITKTTQGKVVLTTKRREAAAAASGKAKVSAQKQVVGSNLTRRVGRGGAISISTKKTPSAIKQQQQQRSDRRTNIRSSSAAK